MSSIIRPIGFNIYYCTFVIIFQCNILSRRFIERRINIQQIIFMKSDDYLRDFVFLHLVFSYSI